jgi:hypothetical protein
MEMLNEWMLERRSELSDMLVSLSFTHDIRHLQESFCLPTQQHPPPPACGLLVVKRKGHNVTHWVTERMHGKLVITFIIACIETFCLHEQTHFLSFPMTT